jgi:quercetin dioxygenase-like cupin family protein
VLGSEITVKTDGAKTGGALTVVETIVPPAYGPPKHVHAKEDETFYILEGQFRLWRGDETLELVSGDVAFLPRNLPHTYQNVGSSPGRLLVMITPSGFEGFFREVSQRGLSAPRDMSEINAVADQYSLKFVGPPPPAPK